MADDKQKPVPQNPAGLGADRATPSPDEKQAMPEPVEEGDFNAQPGS